MLNGYFANHRGGFSDDGVAVHGNAHSRGKFRQYVDKDLQLPGTLVGIEGVFIPPMLVTTQLLELENCGQSIGTLAGAETPSATGKGSPIQPQLGCINQVSEKRFTAHEQQVFPSVRVSGVRGVRIARQQAPRWLTTHATDENRALLGGCSNGHIEELLCIAAASQHVIMCRT